MSGTALITGAYGYLGRLIRASLDAEGWRTVALTRRPHPQDPAAVRWHLGGDLPAWAIAGADVLVHCAYDFDARSRDRVLRTNVRGTEALLDAARAGGVERLMVLSTMSAHEGTRQLYGQAKLAIEDLTLSRGGVAVRPGLVWGDAPGGMVGALLRLTSLPLVPVIGASARQFPVRDTELAAVVTDVVGTGRWLPEVFGVAQRRAMPFIDILRALSARAGRRCRFVAVPWRPAYAGMRLAEMAGFRLPFRSDSVIGLVEPASAVRLSRAFPDLPDRLTELSPVAA